MSKTDSAYTYTTWTAPSKLPKDAVLVEKFAYSGMPDPQRHFVYKSERTGKSYNVKIAK